MRKSAAASMAARSGRASHKGYRDDATTIVCAALMLALLSLASRLLTFW